MEIGRKVRLLLDANIALEIIFDQEKVEEAKALLTKTEEHQFFISNYAFHTIGTILFGKKRQDGFGAFVKDFIIGSGVDVVSLSESEMDTVIKISKEYGLDFDDAYQYAVAEKNDLTLVSFDKDFDRTKRGRKTPAQVLQS